MAFSFNLQVFISKSGEWRRRYSTFCMWHIHFKEPKVIVKLECDLCSEDAVESSTSTEPANISAIQRMNCK